MYHDDDDNHPLATPAEACKEYARNYGAEHPDQEWVLTHFDSWEKNPFFTGTPSGRHPEDDYDREADYVESVLTENATGNTRAPDDDIPF